MEANYYHIRITSDLIDGKVYIFKSPNSESDSAYRYINGFFIKISNEENEQENQLKESYDRQIDADYRMSEARKLK